MVVETQEKDNLEVWMDSKPYSLLEKKNTSRLTNEILDYKNYYSPTLSIELFCLSMHLNISVSDYYPSTSPPQKISEVTFLKADGKFQFWIYHSLLKPNKSKLQHMVC